MLFLESASPKLIEIATSLLSFEELKDFYIVGGTALALQLGHRISYDIDLFTGKNFETDIIIEAISEKYAFKLIRKTEKNTIIGIIEGIKIDFVAHKYPLVDSIVNSDKLRLLSLKDIAVMKLSAISDNGTRSKDFVDIYFLLKIFSLKELMHYFKIKYGLEQSFHILMSLNYFDDVNLEDWPIIIKEKALTWEKTKNFIDLKVREYYKNEIL